MTIKSNKCFVAHDGTYRCGTGLMCSYWDCLYHMNIGFELSVACDSLKPHNGHCTNPAAIAAAEQEDKGND